MKSDLRGDYSRAGPDFSVEQEWAKYTPEEHALYRRLFERQSKLVPRYACPEWIDAIAGRGLKFMPAPPEAYYHLSHDRVRGHAEPIDAMKKHGVLIDGEGVVDGGETRILLQIFSRTVIGPIFFEFIQRKGDDGFGEGNFKALFESIERDQLQRGVIQAS